MKHNLLDYYDQILERLENIDETTKAMVFNLLNIDDEYQLSLLTKMSDEELIAVLSEEDD